MAIHDVAAAHGWNLDASGEHRSPLLSRWGIGLLSLFARLTGEGHRGMVHAPALDTGQSPAEPQPMAPYCCVLANPSGPFCPYSGQPYNYTCPSGYQKMWWYCCYGTQVLGCGECTPANTCWSGPFPCSIWWQVPEAKC